MVQTTKQTTPPKLLWVGFPGALLVIGGALLGAPRLLVMGFGAGVLTTLIVFGLLTKDNNAPKDKVFLDFVTTLLYVALALVLGTVIAEAAGQIGVHPIQPGLPRPV